MIKAHPDFDWYFEVFKNNPALFTTWHGNVLRQSPPRWLSSPFRFTGVGSVLVGARWSVIELMPTVYASTDPDTLNAEAYHKGRRYGWTQADFNAQLKIGMHWELQRVVDLTLPRTLRALRVSRRDILSCDWVAEQSSGREALTQAIARAAFEHLAEGLVVPSARHRGGINVVYYPTHRQPGTIIDVLNQTALPPDMHGLDP